MPRIAMDHHQGCVIVAPSLWARVSSQEEAVLFNSGDGHDDTDEESYKASVYDIYMKLICAHIDYSDFNATENKWIYNLI